MATGYTLTDNAKQNFELLIDGKRIAFIITWNTTANLWFMNATNVDTSEALILGEALVANIDYSSRLGLELSHFFIGSQKQYITAYDPTRYSWQEMQIILVPKEAVIGVNTSIPTNVVTHFGTPITHEHAYVTHKSVGI